MKENEKKQNAVNELETMPERMLRLREDRHLNQLNLGIKLNLSDSAISRYECGTSCPSLGTLIRYSKYFNVSLDYLIRGEDTKFTDSPSKQELCHALNSVPDDMAAYLCDLLRLYREKYTYPRKKRDSHSLR